MSTISRGDFSPQLNIFDTEIKLLLLSYYYSPIVDEVFSMFKSCLEVKLEEKFKSYLEVKLEEKNNLNRSQS